MYCKHCGQEMAEGGKFCPNCGQSLTAEENTGKKKKAKVKKPFYKRWWFWVIVVIFLLGSCGGDTETPADTTPVTEAVATETTVPVTEAPSEAAGVDAVSLDTAVGLLESVIKENFDNYEIYHEEGVIVFNTWEPGIAIGVTLAKEGNAENLAAWNDFIENQKEFSLTLSDFVDTLGLDETMVMVNVLNDGNKENVLLSIAEGVVVYNCVND